MKPSIGRVVHVLVDPATNNGSDVAPAIITRVWNDASVNYRILRDGTPDSSEWKTSASLYGTEQEARDADELVAERHTAAGLASGLPMHHGMRAFWPPRV